MRNTISLMRQTCIAGFTGLCLSTAPVAATAQTQEVEIGIGGSNFLNLTYYYLLLPKVLGYWEEEGYDVDVFPISGSSEAVQQLSVNNLDFAQVNASVIVQSNTQHQLPIRSLVTTGAIDWGVAVQKDGDIKSVEDLKGKSIGIVSLSSGGIPLLNSLLQRNGIDPKSDVTLIATGVGAPAMIALQSDRVQALMYWGSALVGFQHAGLEIDVLRDPEWKDFPDFSLATSQKTIDEKPEMVEAIVRGVAKAMVFAAANPDCVRRIQWTNFPDTKPANLSDEEATRLDLALLDTQLSAQKRAVELNPDGYIAASSADALGKYQTFLKDTGLIATEVDPTSLVPGNPEIWAKANDFDHAAIEEQAKACNFPA